METRQENEETGDLALVHEVIRGADGAWEQFVGRHSKLIYSFCHLIFPSESAGDEYLNILSRVRAEDFAILRAFNGRAKLSTYLTLKIGDVVATRLLSLLSEDAERAWRAFECFFKNDINRIIAKQFPCFAKHETLDDGSSREDVYQEICVLLIDQGYRRIMSYDGRGSFTGYIRRIVQNLCMDLVRKTEGRRRVPEKILQLSALEQEVFKLLDWRGCAEQDLFTILSNEKGNQYSADQVEQATIRVREALSARRWGYNRYGEERPIFSSLTSPTEQSPVKETEVADLESIPEKELIAAEEKTAQERALARLQQALEELPPDERLYIRLRYYTTPAKSPREIAGLMGRSEHEIYKIHQKATAKLKAALKAKELGKISEMSV